MIRYLHHMIFEPTSLYEQIKLWLPVGIVALVLYEVLMAFLRKERR